MIGMLLAEMLGDMGYNARAIAATEDDALADAARCKPGLLIVDEHLGEGNGSSAVSIKRNQRKSLMRKSLAIVLLNLVLLSATAAVLSACNTTAGAGEDVSAAGHAVTNSADKVKAGL